MSGRSLSWLVCLCAMIAIAATFPLACSDTATEAADGGGGGGETDTGGPVEDAGGGDAGVTPDTGGEADTGAAADAGGTDDAGAPFDTCDAGAADCGGGQTVGMMINVSVIEMMAQKIGLAVGAFYPEQNIVPFDPSEGIKGFAADTCRTPATATAECQADADCENAGQTCVLETDQGGKPVPNSGHCENPTEAPIDIGPVTVTGFTDGPHDLKYNPGQNGAYTIDGAGDGQADPATIAADADYTFSGAGDPAQGLGAFSGTFHVPPAINLLEPVPQPSQFGKEITLDTTADAVFKWEGSSNGFVKISIQGDNSSVECLAKDDGEFTIPAAAMATLKLASFSFFNIVNLERTTYGTASGPGLVNPQITSMMTIMVNAKAP